MRSLLLAGNALLFAALLASCGCFTNALIYNDVHIPLTTNMHGNRVGSKMVSLDTHEIHEPVTAAAIGVEWDSRAIGDAAKRLGLVRVDFADLHILRYCFGIYREERIEVWGE